MTSVPFFSIAAVASILSSAGIGMLIGWVHFRALKWNTHLLVCGGSVGRPVFLLAARMLATGAALYLCVRHGVALPAVLVGLLIARCMVLRKAGTE